MDPPVGLVRGLAWVPAAWVDLPAGLVLDLAWELAVRVDLPVELACAPVSELVTLAPLETTPLGRQQLEPTTIRTLPTQRKQRPSGARLRPIPHTARRCMAVSRTPGLPEI